MELREDATDLTHWFDGRICCSEKTGHCEFSLLLPADGRGSCPDFRMCNRLCWTAGYEFDLLGAPVERGDTRGIWRKVHAHYLKWRYCDDGSASEAMAAFLADLLANHGREAPDFFEAARKDERFFAWVLGELDAPGSPPTFERITDNAARSCPSGRTELCGRLRKAALQAATSTGQP